MNLIHAAFEPEGEGPHPTVIAFHGWGANALDLLGLAPYVAQGRFAMLCPQGPLEVPIGPLRGYGWFPIAMSAPPDASEVEKAVRTAQHFVDAAVSRYSVDRKKLVILGFSQGGVMAYHLALRNPERYAAMVGMSTWFPPSLAAQASSPDALRHLHTLVQHGNSDDLIDVNRARDSVETLRNLKVPLVYREYDCGHEVSGEAINDLSQFLTEKILSPIITV